MAKKKKTSKYISDILSQIYQWKEVFFTVSTIAMAIVNVYLSSKLLPITQRIDRIEGKVLANETDIVDNHDCYKELMKKIDGNFDKLDKKIDNIYTILIGK